MRAAPALVVVLAFAGCWRDARTGSDREGICVMFAGNHEVTSAELATAVAGARVDNEVVASTWAAYLDRGYLDYHAGPPRRDERGCVHLKVHEGSRYHLRRLLVAAEARALFPIADGAWFDRSAIARGRDALLARRGDGTGLVDVRVDVAVDRAARTADVTIQLDHGPWACFAWVRGAEQSTDCYRDDTTCERERAAMTGATTEACTTHPGASCTRVTQSPDTHPVERCFDGVEACERFRASRIATPCST